jgi:hypothetical protein
MQKFNLCCVILHFYFYFLHLRRICLELGFWDLEFSPRAAKGGLRDD